LIEVIIPPYGKLVIKTTANDRSIKIHPGPHSSNISHTEIET
jgi:hypothetical protein